jgi:hypothetical protein
VCRRRPTGVPESTENVPASTRKRRRRRGSAGVDERSGVDEGRAGVDKGSAGVDQGAPAVDRRQVAGRPTGPC